MPFRILPLLLVLQIIALTLLQSCTPPALDVELPLVPSKPVVAVQFGYDSVTDQSVVLVTLSRSLSATDGKTPAVDSNGVILDADRMITGATVQLTINGTVYPCDETEKGIYAAFQVSMNGNENCTLSATDANGNPIVQAMTTSVSQVKFAGAWLSAEGKCFKVHYELQDDPQTKDWYVVNYLVKQKQDTAAKYTDPLFIARRLTEQRLDFDLFTDADFRNNKLSRTRTVNDPQADTIGIALSHISEGYFNFLSTQKKQGLLINQVRGEVISFPTNIQGGYGYFSMHNPKVEVLMVQE